MAKGMKELKNRPACASQTLPQGSASESSAVKFRETLARQDYSSRKVS